MVVAVHTHNDLGSALAEQVPGEPPVSFLVGAPVLVAVSAGACFEVHLLHARCTLRTFDARVHARVCVCVRARVTSQETDGAQLPAFYNWIVKYSSEIDALEEHHATVDISAL